MSLIVIMKLIKKILCLGLYLFFLFIVCLIFMDYVLIVDLNFSHQISRMINWNHENYTI